MTFNKDIDLDQVRKIFSGGMAHNIGIEFVEMGTDYLVAKMPVDDRTKQPYGILHGGASAALAETVGSIASHLMVDTSKFNTVGMEINAQHLRPATKGWVFGKALPIHIGRKIQVWEIRITDENEKLICISKLTTMVVEKREFS